MRSDADEPDDARCRRAAAAWPPAANARRTSTRPDAHHARRTCRHWARRTLRAERTTTGTLGRSPRSRPVAPCSSSVLPASASARSSSSARLAPARPSWATAIGHIPEVSYHHEPAATKAAGRYVYEGPGASRGAQLVLPAGLPWLLRIELDGGLRFAEKTPTNAFLVPFLDRAFPDAQFMHIIRDGRDAAASHLHKPWLRAEASRGSGEREPGGYLYGPWAPFWVEPERRDEFETDERRASHDLGLAPVRPRRPSTTARRWARTATRSCATRT